MLKLLSLNFSNIRRFTEEQHIDFSKKTKLIQVDGKNENTGGSSGAGKTTVFLALDYLLGINDIPSTVLQSRLTKEPIYVKGSFLCDDKPLIVVRSKKGLTIDYNGETITGNVKLAEEKLEELIGIPKKIFKKMVHKKQKEGGFFIDMTGKETYEFLSNILNLDKYTSLINYISEDIKKMVSGIESDQMKLELSKSSIKDLESILLSRQKPTVNTSKKETEALENQLKDLIQKKEKAETELAQRLSSLKKPSVSMEQFDNSELVKMSEEMNLLNSKADLLVVKKSSIEKKQAEFPLLIEKAKNISKEISKLKEDQKKIESSVCPTCDQNWVGEQAKSSIKKMSEKIKNLLAEIMKIKDILKNKYELEKEIIFISEEYSKVEKSVLSLKQKIQTEQQKEVDFNINQKKKLSSSFEEYNYKKSQVEDKFKSVLEKLNSLVRSTEMSLSQKTSELSYYEQAISKYEKETTDLAVTINRKNKEIEDLQKNILDAKKRIAVADESKRMIKLFTLQTFQDTLDLIGEMATHILSGISNMQNATVYFEGCKENKDGSIKDEVNGIINLDGEAVPIKSLSGGERTAIDLAVDLAVIDIIESRAGKGADFYVIDEPFDGLDSVCKENSLEILRQIDTNKKIIMVDHSSELKEMVSDVITVVRNGETSSIMDN